MDLSSSDRDLIIRTMLAEAGDQPPIGQAAVAHVILNRRMLPDEYGKTIPEVLFQRNAFEPWGLPKSAPNHPLRFDPNSSAYQMAGHILSGVASGNVPDPTNGSTYFLDPQVVASRVQNGQLKGWPKWAAGEGITIGGHRFFNPEAKKLAQASPGPTDDEILDKYFGAAKPAGATRAIDEPKPVKTERVFQTGQNGPTDDEILNQYFGAPKPVEKPAVTAAQAEPPASLADPIPTVPMYGPNNERINAPFESKSALEAETKRTKAQLEEEQSAAGRIRAIREGMGAIPGNVAGAIGESFGAGLEGFKRGSNQLSSGGRILPDIGWGPGAPATTLTGATVPTYGPKVNDPGAIASMLGGVGGMADSPVAGTVRELVQKPVTELTGSPEIGERAGAVAGLATPFTPLPKFLGGKSVASHVNEMRGSVRGLQTLLDSIPPEEMPSVVKRMENNPNLSAMDVAPQVRTMTAGLAAAPGDWQGFLQNVVNQRRRDAKGEVEGAVHDSLGVSDTAYNVLNGIIQRARDTGAKVINPVVEGARKPADITSVIDYIDGEIAADPVGRASLKAIKSGQAPAFPLSPAQQELLRARSQLRGALPDRDEMFLDVGGEQGGHAIQTGLRQRADTLLNSANGSDRLVGHALMGVRNRLVDAIDDATEGKYKPGLAQYRGDKEIREAFGSGLNFGAMRKGETGILEDSPEAWADWAKSAHPDELDAARLGVLANLDRDVNTMRSAWRTDSAPPIPKIDEYSYRKLSTLFGAEKAKQLVQTLSDVYEKSLTNTMLFGGSQTATRLLGNEKLKVRDVTGKPGSVGSLWPLLAGAAVEPYMHGGSLAGLTMSGLAGGVKVGRYAAQKLGESSDIARNKSFSQWAAATGENRATLMDIMRRKMEAESPAPGDKLRDLLSSPIFSSLPR